VKTTLSLLAFLLILQGCQSPNSVSNIVPASTKGSLTISWKIPSITARTLLPSSYPAPASYNVTLTPTSGSPISQTGLTSMSWTFQNLTATNYTVIVSGLDSLGNLLVQGSSTINTSSSSSSSVQIGLNYIVSGTGTGQLSLTFDYSSSGVSATSATMEMVDPLGNVSTPVLTKSGSTYTYQNLSAVVGSYQIFVRVMTSTQTAMKFEYALVVQDVATTATVNLSSSDFNATYVPVSSLSLNKTSSSSVYDGQTDALTATLNAGASNQALVWSSSNTSYATVTQAGVISILTPGPQTVTITATSVDNNSVSASCVYTIPTPLSVTYQSNGATSGSVPVDSGYYYPGANATVLGNTGGLTKTGYTFWSWNTAVDGSGTGYTPGSSLTFPSTSVVLYAIWTNQTTGGVTVATPPLYAISFGGPSSLNYGVPVTFTSTYTGTPVSYQWYLDGSAISGATSSSLAITPTVSTFTYGANILTLLITDGNGGVYSGSLSVSVSN